MHSQRTGHVPACDRTGRRRVRILAALATVVALLLSGILPSPALAQTDDSRQEPSGEQPERVTCNEATPVFQLLCVAHRVIFNNHVDRVENAHLAREAAARIREADLAERTEGTPPPCALPSPEFEEVCLEIDTVEDTTTAIEMAIRGMIRALDDNSYFLTTAQYRRFRDSIENRGSSGLGLAFALVDDAYDPCFEVSPTCRPVVSEVYSGSPASEAGLMVGDMLVELGDVFPAELGCEAVADLDRFPSGTSVAVTVMRGRETISTTIEAARLAIPAARGHVVDNEIGLLRLDSFGSSAETDVREVLGWLTGFGISGLVFDLRGNPGGFVNPAVGVAGLFLPNLATIVHMVSREKVETVSARGKELHPDPVLLPMVVVTNSHSASASELVSGALQDNGRVTVVGERTYGKDTGQSSYQLHVNGRTVAVLHLTTIRWLTPDSRSAKGGFEPDVTMELPSCLPPSEVALRAISAIRPRVVEVAITTTPHDEEGYLEGDTVAVTVSFTVPVVVTLNGGRPQLRLRVGDGDRTAIYRSGSGTAHLVFEYVVSDSDSDEDGISIGANSVTTGRARIGLPAGLAAILTHESADPDLGQQIAGSREYGVAHAFTPFIDIDDSVHRTSIDQIATAGITQGCGAPGDREFCPDEPVTRAQMATFLTRTLDLPAADRDHFTDDDGNTHEDNINRIALAAISQGCSAGVNDHYCPDQPVTRAQMATLLTHSLDLPAADRDYFTDDDGNTHEDNINRLAAAGISQGCGEGANNHYCPDQPVTRAQMATFLARVLDRIAPVTGLSGARLS